MSEKALLALLSALASTGVLSFLVKEVAKRFKTRSEFTMELYEELKERNKELENESDTLEKGIKDLEKMYYELQLKYERLRIKYENLLKQMKGMKNDEIN